MRILMLCFALLVPACAGQAPRAEAVPTPVSIPCLPVDLPPAPATTPHTAFAVMSRGEVAAILVEEWLEYSAWIARARPYLDACRESRP